MIAIFRPFDDSPERGNPDGKRICYNKSVMWSAIRVTFLTLALGALGNLCAADPDYSSIPQLQQALTNAANIGKAYSVTGMVTFCCSPRKGRGSWTITLSEDGTGHTITLHGHKRDRIDGVRLCDIIAAQGDIHRYTDGGRGLYAECASLDILSSHADTIRHMTSADRFFDDANYMKVVRLRGIVRDGFYDESDPSWLYLSLSCDKRWINATVFADAGKPLDLSTVLGREVELVGEIAESTVTPRKHAGRVLVVSDLSYMRIPDKKNSDEFDVPFIDSADTTTQPEEILSLGLRRVKGRVQAIWNRNNVLVQTESGTVVNLTVDSPTVPAWGSTIEAVGLPGTNYFHLQLEHARWRDSAPLRPESPIETSPLLPATGGNGQQQINMRAHGQPVRIEGVVRHMPSGMNQDRCVHVESDGLLIPVDACHAPDILKRLEVGCRVAVSGVCIVECSPWTPTHLVPKVQGIRIAVKSPDDVTILSRPSWWTPERLMALLGIFAAALLGVVGWNVSLNRRAKAKGRELAAEQLAHVTSELKVSERTRLAVELHDALSQTLTGVSMQIDTAAGFAEGKVPAITKCLGLASRTIDACRMELRNTLWDLRSSALDEPNMDAAIRKTLCQNLAGIDLSVRFKVAREVFSDNTAHAILKIVRELAANALRHGKATALKIAGTVDGGKVLFSVRDNGCGFDPDRAPGIAQGHFGLQGIAERLEQLNGELKIDSAPGKGTKVTVSLPIPRSGE